MSKMLIPGIHFPFSSWQNHLYLLSGDAGTFFGKNVGQILDAGVLAIGGKVLHPEVSEQCSYSPEVYGVALYVLSLPV